MSTQPSSPIPAVAIGQVLDGKYQVLDVLGEGAMGTVYSAWHMGLEQRVAIKVLRNEDEQYDSIARQRFQREARAAARIKSEFVCRVLDTGALSDGTPYLVMEHLDGCDLSTELLKRARLPVADAVRYLRQTCAAVAEAHRAGIIHRDLKPANLFLHVTPSGQRVIKILDFGVSKSSADQGQMSLTRTSALVGSPIYMSPEQIKSSRDVDGRTDIWALGAILVELLAGRAPFDEETIGQLVTAVLHKQPPTLAELGVEAPEGLDAVVQRALHKDCEQRYQTAEQLSAALLPFDEPSADRASLPQRPSRASAESALALSTMRPRSSEPAARSVLPVGADSMTPAVPSLDASHPSSQVRAGVLRRSWPALLLLAAAAAALLVFLTWRAQPPLAKRVAPPAPIASAPAASTPRVAPVRALAEVSAPVQDDAAALQAELTPAAAPEPSERPLAERRRAKVVSPAPAPEVQKPQLPQSADSDLPNFGGRR